MKVAPLEMERAAVARAETERASRPTAQDLAGCWCTCGCEPKENRTKPGTCCLLFLGPGCVLDEAGSPTRFRYRSLKAGLEWARYGGVLPCPFVCCYDQIYVRPVTNRIVWNLGTPEHTNPVSLCSSAKGPNWWGESTCVLTSRCRVSRCGNERCPCPTACSCKLLPSG